MVPLQNCFTKSVIKDKRIQYPRMLTNPISYPVLNVFGEMLSSIFVAV